MLFERIRELFARCAGCGARWSFRNWRPGYGFQLMYHPEGECWLCSTCFGKYGPKGPPRRGDLDMREWKRIIDQHKKLLKASGGVV
jgi:hypothetical protein